MGFNFTQLTPFILAVAGTAFFLLIARAVFSRLSFDLGRGSYVGGLPQLGALFGLLCLTSIGNFSPQFIALLLTSFFLAIVGLLDDLKKITGAQMMLLILLLNALYSYQIGLKAEQVINATAWCGLIFVCLKIASLVYEMPFILTATSALTILIYFTRENRHIESLLLTWALLAWAIVFLFYSSSGKRALTGSSGLAATALLIGSVSFLENTGRLMLFAMLIPSMVIGFPVLLLSILLIGSYFGNRLHQRQSRRERLFNWSLEREKTVVFSGMIFFCLNFLGLLVVLNAPWYGYFALFVLLLASLVGFFRTFARKETLAIKEEPDRVEIMEQWVDAVTPDDVLQRVIEHQKNGKGLSHIITADSLALLRCLEEERFGNVMRRAELVVPDGAGIVWASDFLGCPLPGRVPGVALVDQLCSMAEKNGLRIYFLGGKPGIAEKAVEKMRQKYPQLPVAGFAHGYFKAESSEEEQIMRQIIEAKTDILLVALGVPGQEWFISRFRLTGHKCAAVGVGGSFDVISETLPRAPGWMQQFGIEWLFRLWLEPFRIGRIAKIPAFVLQVFRYKWNRE